jgi:hypothetical protein
MPFNNYNPVMNGMQTAYDIAQRIQNQAIQQSQLKRMEQEAQQRQEEFKYTQQRNKEQDKRQQQQDELTHFQNLVKMQDAGIREATPQDITEATAPRFIVDEAGNRTPAGVGSDIRTRLLNYQGKQYVVPSEQDLLQKQAADAKIENSMAAAKKGAEARAAFEATATEMPGPLSERLGLPAGLKVGPSVQDDVIRALLQLANPTPETFSTQSTDQGIIQVGNRTGATRPVMVDGKPATRTPRAAAPRTGGAGGEMTAAQQATADRNARQDKRQELVDLEAREDKTAKAVVAATNKKSLEEAKGEQADPKLQVIYQRELTRTQSALKRIRQEKVNLGFTTAEDAGLGTGSPAPGNVTPLTEPLAAPKPGTWEYYKALKTKTGGQ